ncbi:DUF2795 domain-containing protein [Streptomyces sp. ISL-94]|uniref:DUF2795 domain-containing protein n=1 Tax=Streptomyces sp. ISL-94 TaxID=2819190 RepID=UPI001BEB5C59|nr:DUF2795 domain-containing protein [Streptomyces sp. ISL-94]MBT2478876.1 DUF2795 domain-containing protein [Streptomyces sp. ISL-94]
MADVNPIEVQKALKGAEYPAKRDDLVQLAKRNGAGEEITQELASSSKDRFNGPDDVQKSVFGRR